MVFDFYFDGVTVKTGNSLGKLLKGIGEKAGLNEEKNVRNHSARETMLNDLCEANNNNNNNNIYILIGRIISNPMRLTIINIHTYY